MAMSIYIGVIQLMARVVYKSKDGLMVKTL